MKLHNSRHSEYSMFPIATLWNQYACTLIYYPYLMRIKADKLWLITKVFTIFLRLSNFLWSSFRQQPDALPEVAHMIIRTQAVEVDQVGPVIMDKRVEP
jgi:hypothetical protein